MVEFGELFVLAHHRCVEEEVVGDVDVYVVWVQFGAQCAAEVFDVGFGGVVGGEVGCG